MRKIVLIIITLALVAPSLALTDYQQGVLDGLNRGWNLALLYDQAKNGDPTAYNQAVPKYNDWITSIFGQNDSLMIKPINNAIQPLAYSVTKTVKPIHQIDATWNQTPTTPQPDANGLIYGVPAEVYDSWGPAIVNF
jgi:hypothetical protein